jgi:hypothetical protein
MRLMIIALLALAACSGQQEEPDEASNAERRAVEAAAAGFHPASPGPMATLSTDPVDTPAPGALIPPPTESYRFLGRWAVNTALCRENAWAFEPKKLVTSGGTECRFENVSETLDGYNLAGVCEAGGIETTDTLKATFNAATRSMRIAGKSLGPVELIYCGP